MPPVGFFHRADTFAGRPVIDHADPEYAASPKKYTPRFARAADFGAGPTAADRLTEFFAGASPAWNVAALVIGPWSADMEGTGPASELEVLALLRDRLPNLRHLFVGDVLFRECMTSVMVQADYGPLLAAYPRMETLKVRASNGLRFGDPFRHPSLRTLIVEDGGLQERVYRAVAGADLPALERLELWVGSGDSGGVSDLGPVRDLLASLGRFPRLRHLGLPNAADADGVAAVVAESGVLARLRTLDLSMGTLTDAGADALLASPDLARMEGLDLSHHYLSEAARDRVRRAGVPANLFDPQEAVEDGTHVYRFNAVSE